MAKNLFEKIPQGDTLSIFDVNTSSIEKLNSETKSDRLRVAKSPKEVAQQSVSEQYPFPCLHDEPFCSIYDLSWGYGFRVMLLL